MRVDSRDRYVDVGEFDPDTGRLQVFRREFANPDERPCGHFGQLAGERAVLYRSNDDLYLRVGDRAMLLDDTATATWRRLGGKSVEFQIKSGDQEFRATYETGPPYGPPLEEDPTPHISLEDWDFGLFVVNVLHEPGRRRRIYP